MARREPRGEWAGPEGGPLEDIERALSVGSERTAAAPTNGDYATAARLAIQLHRDPDHAAALDAGKRIEVRFADGTYIDIRKPGGILGVKVNGWSLVSCELAIGAEHHGSC